MGCRAILVCHTKNRLQGESNRYPLLPLSTSLQKRMPNRIQMAATAVVRRLKGARLYPVKVAVSGDTRYHVTAAFGGKLTINVSPAFNTPFALLFESTSYQSIFGLGAKRNETWVYMSCSFLLFELFNEGSFATVYVIFPFPLAHFLHMFVES